MFYIQNSFAAELFDRFEVLRIVENRLSAVRRVENRALHQAIRDIADLPDGSSYEIDKLITIKSKQCEQPFLINIHPLGQIFSIKKAETVPVVILSVRDPNKPHHPKSCSFSALYDLTPAQSRLSSLLFSGYTLSDAAKSLNVSENTAAQSPQTNLSKNTYTWSDGTGSFACKNLHRSCLVWCIYSTA